MKNKPKRVLKTLPLTLKRAGKVFGRVGIEFSKRQNTHSLSRGVSQILGVVNKK